MKYPLPLTQPLSGAGDLYRRHKAGEMTVEDYVQRVGGAAKWERGENHHAAKLTERLVREMRALYLSGEWSYSRLGKYFGVNVSCVCKIIKRIHWKHVQ